MKVLMFGSREWVWDGVIYRLLSKMPKDTIIVHGAARGADTIAGSIAENLGLEVRDYPADWYPNGPDQPMDKGAGPKRNALMLREEHPHPDGTRIDKAYGFSTGSQNKGTTDMSERLWAARIRFEILFPPSQN